MLWTEHSVILKTRIKTQEDFLKITKRYLEKLNKKMLTYF